MKIFSSKRAQTGPTEETMFPIFAAIIAFGVILLELFFTIDAIGQNTIFEKGFLERDLANVIDSLYISPGNIMIDYDKDTKFFSFIFDKNSVNAYERLDVFLPDKMVYYFTPDKKMTYPTIELKTAFKEGQNEENLIEKVNLRLAKTDKMLQIDRKELLLPDLNELECSEVEDTKEFTKSAFKDFDDISKINDLEGRDNALDEGNDVYIWYYPGNYDESKNTIKAFISSDFNLKENRRLACLIINSLLYKFGIISEEDNFDDINGVAIIPTDSWQMLNQERYLSVLLEIGNKNILQEKNLWSDSNTKNIIKEAIDEGINLYGKKNE